MSRIFKNTVNRFKLHFLTKIGELIPKHATLGKSEIMEARVRRNNGSKS